MIVAAAIIVSMGMMFASYILADAFIKLDKSGLARHATMCCLLDLVNKLNKEFPGSNLTVQDNTNEVKVIGELKYHKPFNN